MVIFSATMFYINPVAFSFNSQIHKAPFCLNEQASNNFFDIVVVGLISSLVSVPFQAVLKWLLTLKSSISGLGPSMDPKDIKCAKIKSKIAYILYGLALPLNLFGLITITSHLEIKVANEIMISVATSYGIDFFIVQSLKALFQTGLVFYLFKTSGHISQGKKKLAAKLLDPNLLRKIK